MVNLIEDGSQMTWRPRPWGLYTEPQFTQHHSDWTWHVKMSNQNFSSQHNRFVQSPFGKVMVTMSVSTVYFLLSYSVQEQHYSGLAGEPSKPQWLVFSLWQPAVLGVIV